MWINDLNKIWLNLPKWITWINCDESLIFVTWNIINAWCEKSCWNVITLTINDVNEIIDLNCDAKKWNRCWNVNVDSEICTIDSEIKKTT